MKKIVFGFIAFCLANIDNVAAKAECNIDNRIPSHQSNIGRLLGSHVSAIGTEFGSVCTVTLISSRCALTAGHCYLEKWDQYVEFQVPDSKLEKNPFYPACPQSGAPENRYEVDKASAVYQNQAGNDWAVIRLKRNLLTSKFAGDVQGFSLVSFRTPDLGSAIRITGYGGDNSNPVKDYTQQTSVGIFKSYFQDHKNDPELFRKSDMLHTAFSPGGTSGAAIFEEKSQLIFGIHNSSRCRKDVDLEFADIQVPGSGGYHGTLISTNLQLQAAITACLDE